MRPAGSGTRVASHAAAPKKTSQANRDASPRWEVDLTPGLPDLASFPAAQWKRALAHSVDNTNRADLAYAHLSGSPELRDELCAYLRRVRGADIDPANMIITNGVSAGLCLISRVIAATRQPRFGLEDPGSYLQRHALESAGARTVPILVDEHGVNVRTLEGQSLDAVVVTPAHQYPTGVVLSADRRSELIRWATSTECTIIEDDYDAEFRFDRQPVGALQGLAPDNVALAGSVSKTLAPGLRLGWLAVPAHLAQAATETISREFATPSVIEQNAFAHLIGTGQYDRIIRQRRRTYEQLHQELARRLSVVPGCEIIGAAGGLHLTMLLPEECDDLAVSAALRVHKILAPPLSDYRINAGPPGLVLSFASLTRSKISTAAAALIEVLAA